LTTGKKDLESLKKIKKRVKQKLLKRKGVNGVGFGRKITDGKPTGEIAIRVYVDKKIDDNDISSKRRIPRQIGGMKTDIIERNKRIILYSSGPWDPTLYDPLIGGGTVGPLRFGNLRGTIGAIAVDNSTGNRVILSCYHVLAVDGNWPSADRTILQPPQGLRPNEPNRIIGRLTRATLMEKEGVDAAVAEIDQAVQSDFRIAQNVSIKGVAEAQPHARVRKVGAATGLTYGVIDAVLTPSLPIDYEGLGSKTLDNQIHIVPYNNNKPFSLPGDSGAAVIDDHGNIVGLVICGTDDGQDTYANHIQPVMSRVGIKGFK
jgi:hypothetical protein